MDDYFITGYTGFCPDIAEHIGHNYHKATREIMKVHPHVKTRLSSVSYPPKMERYESDRDSFCCVPPEYVPTFQKDLVNGNVWRPCQGDGPSCDSTHPEKAYSLSCSEWGSPCVAKHCNEIYSPCIGTKSYYCEDHIMMPSKIASAQQVQQTDSKISESCCDSCAKGGSCSEDSNFVSKYPRKKSEYCCNSCAKGRRCIEDGTRKGTSIYKYPGKRTVSSRKIMNFREGGVIPNYMGHIPGMQQSFGESYGIASCRLLRRHFDEQYRRKS